jgi:hypothetical protein
MEAKSPVAGKRAPSFNPSLLPPPEEDVLEVPPPQAVKRKLLVKVVRAMLRAMGARNRRWNWGMIIHSSPNFIDL